MAHDAGVQCNNIQAIFDGFSHVWDWLVGLAVPVNIIIKWYLHREMMKTNNIAFQNNGTKDTATTKFSILNYFRLLALDCVHFVLPC